MLHPSTMYRFRKQRGVNLGSWFVLERWITAHPFRSAAAPAQSDLDVARGHHARAILEEHYDNWITDADWTWIAQHGFNSVRLPIGFYHLCGADASVLHSTDFAEFGAVFSGAWSRIVHAIECARRHGLGVLIDLHAAPGKQNPDSHSGSSGLPTFFTNPQNRQQTIHALRTLARQLKALDLVNVVGIELLNEPHPTSDSILKQWYSDACDALAAVDPTMPIYVGDCWKTEQYTDFVKSKAQNVALMGLDHHLYRCFTAEDIKTPAPVHTRSLSDPNAHIPKLFARVADTLDEAGAGLVIGEWSGALNPGSLTGSPDDAKTYIAAQLALYEAHCVGYYFWTYKKDGGPDRGWCLRDAVESGVYPDAPRGVVPSSRFVAVDHDLERRQCARDAIKDRALENHTAYWSRFPGKYQHARFADGFVLGWDDAYAFLTFEAAPNKPCSELAFVGALARMRTRDHGSSFWEFRHGFQQGAAEAKKDFSANYC
ncbi:Glucan 1,3-beta-glucosidase 3 [Mycena kentingensis (nom. inval.)]|nr:Glucan 1,3-beta-glucosidase 3 [Mycena kentingensis (nom. inval.)]